MIVGLTGVTGNMGTEALIHLLENKDIDKFRLFILNNDKNYKRVKKLFKKNKDRLEFVYGNLKNIDDVKKFATGLDYIVNMAAVIPPKSDKFKQAAIDCNETGVKNLVSVIENLNPQPKLIHTSTVALYGNRTEAHPYGIVGDPLLVSPFDLYSLTKLRGELMVLESNIKYFAVIRQSAMLHKYMLMDNISDGLMFHTCFNSPLEWTTASDSGLLIANIIKKDMKEDLSNKFWRRCFNIGALPENRITGFDTLEDGFKLMGGSTKKMFKPDFNATRNFHGMWFYDGKKLDDLFDYQKESVSDYWKMIGKKNWYYKFGKIVPQSLISKLVIQRLFKDDNSIKYWYNHKDYARMYATFGGINEYEKIGKDWNNFKLLKEDSNYSNIRDINKTKLIDYGYNINKDLSLIDEADIKNIAKLHGGEMLGSFVDLYTPIKFKNSDDEEFLMRPYSVICGHWLNITYKEYKWDFDRLSKKDKIYASIWYDSHLKNEDKVYSFDENFNACMEGL
ncbi:MAG: NAD-dependent epimerase/dehydratase family protein [Acholeplasmatales bacterium]|nr:NAD-dependent epimerase/dehydratase family protein [Acholeplasmatales bacterium]